MTIRVPVRPRKGEQPQPLFPHQARFLQGERARQDRIALFWHMRLGKTRTLILWALSKPGARARLVVAPLTVLRVWKTELEMLGQKVLLLRGSVEQKARAVSEFSAVRSFGGGWVLLNYEATFLRIKDRQKKLVVSPLLALPWDVAVLDESTAVRNPQSKTSRALTKGLSEE